MKGEARRIAVWPPDSLPCAIPLQFATHRTGGILNKWDLVPPADRNQSPQITGHPYLVYANNSARSRIDSLLHKLWVNVEGVRFDIHEHRRRTAVSNAIRGSNEGMTYRDNFITLAHPCGQ